MMRSTLRATDLSVKGIGEDINLGATQRVCIEFEFKGGRCNSDTIDNLDCINSSDV